MITFLYNPILKLKRTYGCRQGVINVYVKNLHDVPFRPKETYYLALKELFRKPSELFLSHIKLLSRHVRIF